MSAKHGPAACPTALAETLRRWALRQRRQHAARTLAWTVAVAGLLVAAAMATDLAGDPLPWLRVGLAASALLGLLLGATVALRRLLAPWGRLATARVVERHTGQTGEPLSGPLGLLERPVPGHSAWMTERSLALAAVAADALDLRRLLPWRPVIPALIAAAVTVLVLVSAALIEPAARAAINRAVLPWRELPAPGDELLVAEPGDTWLAPGASQPIAVRGQPVALTAELAWADGQRESRELQRDGAVQRLVLGPLHRDLRWRVRGPGLSSPWHQATLVAVPRLASLAMQLEPPGYTSLPAERVLGGDAAVLTGAEVAIDLVLEGPPAVTAAVVTDGREVPVPLARSPYGGQFGAARLRVTADLDWRLRLIVAGGPGGVVVDLPQRWRLRAIPDRPPEASATIDGAVVAPGRAVRLSVLASDDVALASAWIELAVEGTADPVRLALPVPAGTRRLEAAAAVVPADLGARPGDRLTAVPVARDRAGTETHGSAIHITVAQPLHAARHDLVSRLDDLIILARSAVEAATEGDKAWRAAVRSWREEDPAAGAAGLRAAATRVRNLSTSATAVADGAAAAAVLGDAPANLGGLADRAIGVAGGALALAARSTAAEGGANAAVSGAAEAAAELVRGAESLATSAGLAASAAAAAAATADLESARDQLAGAAAVLAAERAWSMPSWRPGLLGTFWRGNQPGIGEARLFLAEAPGSADRDLPGLGRTDWCANWIGEVLLPEAGRWTFRCTADDGVRLRLAGQDILPPGSWRDQGATAYLGSLDLPAGWQPITVEYYQGGGSGRLLVEAGRGEPAEIPIERLRHRQPPDHRARQAMAALPAGAGEAAVQRARRGAEQALAAGAAIRQAVTRTGGGPTPVTLIAQAEQVGTTLEPLRGVLDWSDAQAVEMAAAAAMDAAGRAADLARRLGDACRHDGRRSGGDGFTDRLRDAAAKPGGKLAQRVSDELAVQRTALAATAADSLGDPAQRAAALAAAWAIDAVLATLNGPDSDAARAAVAAATPPLALAARHARAAEASAGLARQGGAVLAELALSPGWPPGLLRPARDLLRQAAAGLRAGDDPEHALRLAGEVSRACEMEALRPGVPPSEELASATAWLRDQAVLPQAEALAEIADLLEQVDRNVPQSRPEARALAAAAEKRRGLAAGALADSAAGLAAAVPAIAAAGLPELSLRAGSLAELARTLASAPDQQTALGLSEALAGTLAAPLAEALANGRFEPGSAAAQAGRLAAQAAAAAAALASIIVPVILADDEPTGWDRSHDRSASEAASAAAAVDFPEEHRAAIRAYLRRIGVPR